MYDHKIGDEVMVEVGENITQAKAGSIHSIQDYTIQVEVKDNAGFLLQIPKQLVFPILTITDVNQWQIQKHTIRAINRILKQQPPDQQ